MTQRTSKGSSRIDRIGQNGNDGLHYSKSLFHDQYEFLKAGDADGINLYNEKLANSLVSEEYQELQNEPFYLDPRYDDINTIKEALDLIYVTCQYLNVTIGPDKALACWDALQQNNMSKCIDGKLVKREDGKILKPEGYQKLDLTEILNDTSE